MDVYNDGKRIVGPDRAISQNPDRFRAKRSLDVDLARRDVGQVWCRNGAQRCERIGATPRQGFGGQRQQWPQRECIAKFGVDKFDCAHGWQPGPCGAKKTVRQRLPSDKSAWISHIDCNGRTQSAPKRRKPSMVDSPGLSLTGDADHVPSIRAYGGTTGGITCTRL